MSDCTCNNFPAGLGNVTFGASVGIGTPSPGARLEVVGATADGSAYAVIIKNSAGQALFRVRNDGPVQIRDTDTQDAAVVLYASRSEDIVFNGLATAVASIHVDGIDVNNPYLAFYTNPNYPGGGNTEQVRIDKNGKVGIGTASPSEKLEVNGNLKLPAGSWLLLGGGVAGNKGMNYDSAAKNLNVRNDEDGGTMYLTVKNGRVYFNQYGGSNVAYIEVPAGNASFGGKVTVGGRDAINSDGYCLFAP